jgi:peptidoglycan/xylan/chitin deacetylase (PgdA/CDA1 family)
MWPLNSRAAVSITYDDGHDSNLDVAIPDLEARGLTGTFFITPSLGAVQRANEWRLACGRGHEIANHTWDHPCDRLRSFSAEQFTQEQTGNTEAWLDNNIGLNGMAGQHDDNRTYAYICGQELLGPGSESEARERYRNLVEKTFLACRSVSGPPVKREDVLAKRFNIPALGPTYGYGKSDRAIAYCEEAAAAGTWAVLFFHYFVDGEPSKETETNRQVHCEILDHLANNPDKYWVAPFREVYRHITAGG